ncbi:hypothetical protein ACWKT5_26565, partial [Streptomyces avermitilis]
MTQTVIDGGWAPSEPVQQALRTLPRHRFAPEADLATAYDGGDRAVITRRDEIGAAISSVSAAWLQADMIERLHLKPGAVVFEAGSGGYNAELIAHVTGPDGHVVTVDIDPWVVRRTRAFTTEAGSGRATAVEDDAALGAPARLVPRGGFDGQLLLVPRSVQGPVPAPRGNPGRETAPGRAVRLCPLPAGHAPPQ